MSCLPFAHLQICKFANLQICKFADLCLCCQSWFEFQGHPPGSAWLPSTFYSLLAKHWSSFVMFWLTPSKWCFVLWGAVCALLKLFFLCYLCIHHFLVSSYFTVFDLVYFLNSGSVCIMVPFPGNVASFEVYFALFTCFVLVIAFFPLSHMVFREPMD